MENRKEYFSTKQKIHLMWDYIWQLFSSFNFLDKKVIKLEEVIEGVLKKVNKLFLSSGGIETTTITKPLCNISYNNFIFTPPPSWSADPASFSITLTNTIEDERTEPTGTSFTVQIHFDSYWDEFMTVPALGLTESYTLSGTLLKMTNFGGNSRRGFILIDITNSLNMITPSKRFIRFSRT